MLPISPLVLTALVSFQAPSTQVAQEVSRELVLRGHVYEPSGAPAEGAVVLSSAGGQAVTDWSGGYELRLPTQVDAKRLRVTAVGAGSAGLAASAEVERLAVGGALQVPGLFLAEGTSCPPRWLPTFGAQPGTDGFVQALAVYDDGDGPALYVGGSFTLAGGVPAGSVARWDGSNWSPLGSGLDGVIAPRVHRMIVADVGDGLSLYVAGTFTTAGGVDVGNIARWDGNWHDVGGGTFSYLDEVFDLEVFDEGSGPALFAAGDFSNAGGLLVNGIARFDGTSWSPVGPGFLVPDVRGLQVFDDGSGEALYAVGRFSSLWSDPPEPMRGIARWDGTSWSDVGGSLNGSAECIEVFDDGGGPELYVGGWFTQAGGVSTHKIGKWDGSQWSGVGSGVGDAVFSMSVADDGNGSALYVGGFFETAGGAPAENVAKWDGSSWSALASGANQAVYALTAFDDGGGSALYVGGYLSNAGGIPASGIGKWQGGQWKPLPGGLDAEVLALAVFDDGDGPALYVAGDFVRTSGGPVDYLARWDGAAWQAVGPAFDREVEALVVYDDGNGSALYAGGRFIEAGGQSLPHIARWDGSSWSGLDLGVNQPVYALAVVEEVGGDVLYAGGALSGASGTPCKRVARWDGVNWTPLAGGCEGPVYALTQYDDGTGPALFVGGDFNYVDGNVLVKRVAKWDGATWSALGTGLNGEVRALTVFEENGSSSLVVGGAFTQAAGSPAKRVARWDGASWSPMGDGFVGHVRSLVVHDDGGGPSLYAGGGFEASGANAMNRLARWNGTRWLPLGGGTSGRVLCLASFGRSLVAGGEFASAYDSRDAFLARWACESRELTQRP